VAKEKDVWNTGDKIVRLTVYADKKVSLECGAPCCSLEKGPNNEIHGWEGIFSYKLLA
jgi:hypothetical protein